MDRIWQIPTTHFDPDAARNAALGRPARPLEEVLVEGSRYSRDVLKRRLFAEGLKTPVCEMCGQGPEWRGAPLALILDHINGVGNDNRLGNLRIVCPNCAATLTTHCGRKNRTAPVFRECERCGKSFVVRNPRHRYCSRDCGSRANRGRSRGVPHPERRKVARPPYFQLLSEVEESGYEAVGRTYGVSGNAVRKWLRQCERESLLRERTNAR